jgi:hypothetical protein
MSKEITPEEAMQKIYSHAAQMAVSGRTYSDIQADLIEKGIDKESAVLITDDIKTQIRKNTIKKGRRNLLFGSIWFFGGLVVTIWTFSSALLYGGTYYVAWGAVLLGGIQMARGIFQIFDM